jgi:hypothetical protein
MRVGGVFEKEVIVNAETKKIGENKCGILTVSPITPAKNDFNSVALPIYPS